MRATSNLVVLYKGFGNIACKWINTVQVTKECLPLLCF